MSNSKVLVAGTLALAVIPLAACQSSTPGSPPTGQPGICQPAAAEALTGRPGVSDAQAMQLTGATIVRQIRPGQAVTMDYRQERVTIETDPNTNRILRAMCG